MQRRQFLTFSLKVDIGSAVNTRYSLPSHAQSQGPKTEPKDWIENSKRTGSGLHLHRLLRRQSLCKWRPDPILQTGCGKYGRDCQRSYFPEPGVRGLKINLTYFKIPKLSPKA